MGSFCLLVGFFWLVFVLLFLFVDQSLRSSYLPMTILAQLRDCHSCYDERSIDQKKPTRCDMSLPIQWMTLICLAIFSGLSGQRTIPSGVLMRGKVIGFNWTDVASWPLLELNNFSMPSVWTQDDPGGQPHVRRWVSRQATL